MMSRVVSVCTAFVLCMGCFPVAAYAETGDLLFSDSLSDVVESADSAGEGVGGQNLGGQNARLDGEVVDGDLADRSENGLSDAGLESEESSHEGLLSQADGELLAENSSNLGLDSESVGIVENSWRYEEGQRILFDDVSSLSSVPSWSKTDEGFVNSAGEVIEGALCRGIDVSEHNGAIDWDKVAASGEVDFVLIRCGYGLDRTSQDDLQWLSNVVACERLGIPYGVYLYSYAENADQALGEADHALRLLEGHSPNLPVYLDLEESNLADASNAELLASIARAFCEKIEASGYAAGVYANLWWWNNFLTDPCFDCWDRWVAQYSSVCSYAGSYSLWQCTDGGTIDGISGSVDINFSFKGIAGKLEGDSSDDPFENPYAEIDALASVNRDVLPDGSYVIMTDLANGQVLDVKSGSSGNGANVQLYESNMTLAQRWRVSHDSSGYVTLTCSGSGKVLDVKSGKATKGTNVQQYESNDSRAQKWIAIPLDNGGYMLMSALSSDYVLDVSGGKSANGTNVQIYTSNATKAQSWRFFSDEPQVDPCEDMGFGDGWYKITSDANPSLSVDVKAASTSNGASVQAYLSNGTLAQMYRFEFVDRGDGLGYYQVICAASGKALDVKDGNLVPGASVQQWTASKGNDNQLFSIRSMEGGSCVIVSKSTGLAIGLASGSVFSGSSIRLHSPDWSSNQTWRVAAVEYLIPEGIYTISSALSASKVLDVKSGSTANGANVQIYASNGTLAQKWQVVHAENGAIALECLASGLRLAADANGNVCQRVAKDDDSQLWTPSVQAGKIILVNMCSGKCLDVASGKTANGTNVQVYAPNGTSAQSFVFSSCDPLAAGVYIIKSSNISKVIDVKSASKANGANVQLYGRNDTVAQMWKISRNADGSYTVLNFGSGKALDVKSAAAVSGANVQQYSSNSTAAQKWYIEYAGDGSFRLVSALGGSLALTIEGGSAVSGANVCVSSSGSASTQRFTFEKVGVRSLFVATALSQANGRPSGGSSNKYNNYSGEPWCAYFMVWCARNSNASLSAVPNIYLCSSLKGYYKTKGLWHGAGYTPKAGDIIFYSSYSGGVPSHVGIVTSCSNGTVYTKEGNVGGGKVGSRVRAVGAGYVASSWYVVGYASPDF